MYKIILTTIYVASVVYCYSSFCSYMDAVLSELCQRHPATGLNPHEWHEPGVIFRLLLASSIFPINIAAGYFFQHLPDGFMDRVLNDVEKKYGDEIDELVENINEALKRIEEKKNEQLEREE